MMSILSFTSCCRLLAIDPKTFRRWLVQAQVPVHPDPLDARIKGITREHLFQIAAAHRRTLPDLREDQPLLPPTGSTVESPSPASPTIELFKALTTLSAQIAGLEHQLLLLTQQIQQIQQPLQEPAACIPAENALVASRAVSPASDATTVVSSSGVTDGRRKRAQVLPLVEYGVHGGYMVICPTQGILSLEPDSPEWFTWLETLSSFRFVGKLGRLTAHREVKRSPRAAWRAHREIRNQSYNHRLGQTECLTITALEQAATALQAHMM